MQPLGASSLPEALTACLPAVPELWSGGHMRTGPTVGMGVRCQSQGYGRVWGLPGHPAPSDLPQQMGDPTGVPTKDHAAYFS